MRIDDLPPELILRIFEFARGGVTHPDHDPFAEEWEDAKLDFDIVRSLRLTSRGFCEISSELLLRRLDVSLSVESLEHFEEVARNPSIARGIRAIRLNLDCYFDTFKNQTKFFEHIEAALEQHRESVHDVYCQYLTDLNENDPNDRDPEQEAWFETNGLTLDPPLSKQKLNHMEQRLEDLQNACSALLESGVDNPLAQLPGVRIIMEAMERGHATYQRFWWEQEGVFHNNRIVKVLADGIMKMPRARRLLITDDQGHLRLHHHHPWPNMLDDVDFLLQEEFLRPRRWSEWGPLVTREDRELGGPFPTFLLHALPRHFSKKCHFLKHLDIRLSATDRIDWELEVQDFSVLRDSANFLKTFRCLIDTPWLEGPPKRHNLTPFLRAFASGRRLETYEIALTRAPSRALFGVPFSPLLIEFQSPTLYKVRITGCIFDVSTVKRAMNQHKIKLHRLQIPSLTLKYAKIVFGTAVEAQALLGRLAMHVILHGREGKSTGRVDPFSLSFPSLWDP